MRMTTEYSKQDLHKGKCISCGVRTLILKEHVLDDKFENLCPECVEACKFEEATWR